MGIPEAQGRVVEVNENDDDEIPKWMGAMGRKKGNTGVRIPANGESFLVLS